MPVENPGPLPERLTPAEAARWEEIAYGISQQLADPNLPADQRARLARYLQDIANYLRDRGYRHRGGGVFQPAPQPGTVDPATGQSGGGVRAPYTQRPPVPPEGVTIPPPRRVPDEVRFPPEPPLPPRGPRGPAGRRPRPPGACPDAPLLGGLPFVVGEELYNRYAESLGLPRPIPLEQAVADQGGSYLQDNPWVIGVVGGPAFAPFRPGLPTPAPGNLPVVRPDPTGGQSTLPPGNYPTPFRDPSDPFGRNPILRGQTQGQRGPVTNPFGPQPPSWTQDPTPPYPLILTPNSPGWIDVRPPWNNPGSGNAPGPTPAAPPTPIAPGIPPAPVPGNPADWGGPCGPDPPPRPPRPVDPGVAGPASVDASGCGLPTPAVARTYSVTVSGVTNLTCLNCNSFNKAWGLTFGSHSRGAGVSDCGWDSLDPPGFCTPVGPYGNVEMRYSTAGGRYELLFKGAGGSANQATYTCAAANFNGLGSSLFSRSTGADSAGCDNWPASLAVNAA